MSKESYISMCVYNLTFEQVKQLNPDELSQIHSELDLFDIQGVGEDSITYAMNTNTSNGFDCEATAAEIAEAILKIAPDASIDCDLDDDYSDGHWTVYFGKGAAQKKLSDLHEAARDALDAYQSGLEEAKREIDRVIVAGMISNLPLPDSE